MKIFLANSKETYTTGSKYNFCKEKDILVVNRLDKSERNRHGMIGLMHGDSTTEIIVVESNITKSELIDLVRDSYEKRMPGNTIDYEAESISMVLDAASFNAGDEVYRDRDRYVLIGNCNDSRKKFIRYTKKSDEHTYNELF